MRSLMTAFSLPMPRLSLKRENRLPLVALAATVGAVGMVGLAVARSEQASTTLSLSMQNWGEAWQRTMVNASGALGITLQQVTVSGRVHTPGGDILGAIDLPQGGPLLSLDPAAVREQIESLPWVKEAIVERQLPHNVHVRISERTPIALWQSPDGGYHLIDVKGVVIADSYAGFGGMLVVVGDGAPEATNDLLLMLAGEPEIAQRVKAAVRFGQRRWDLWLDGYSPDGIQVRLPERDPAQGLARLLRLEREQQILQRDISMIDLRLEDRLAIQPVEHPAAATGTAGNKGKPGAPAASRTSAPAASPGKPQQGLPLRGPAQDT